MQHNGPANKSLPSSTSCRGTLIPQGHHSTAPLASLHLRTYIQPKSKAALGLMQTLPHTLGTFDISLDPYTTLTDREISAQLHALIPDPSLHFPPNPLSPTNQSFTMHSLTPGTVLNNDVRLLENLGIGRASARRHAEDTALAMATYAQQDEDRWIHKLASISRELGYLISPNLPQKLLLSPTDRL
jgi:hypothetical protein